MSNPEYELAPSQDTIHVTDEENSSIFSDRHAPRPSVPRSLNNCVSAYQLLLLPIVNIGYYQILMSCTLDPDECTKQSQEKILYYFELAFLFTFATLAIFLHGIHRSYYLNSLMAVLNFAFMTNLKPGYDWINHGSYAKIVCYIFLALLLSILALVFLIYRFIATYKAFALKVLASATVLLLLCFHVVVVSSKSNADRGFNNQRVSQGSNIPAECTLKEYYFPNYDLGTKILKPFTNYMDQNCSQQKNKEHHLFYNRTMNQALDSQFQVYPDIQKIGNYTTLPFDILSNLTFSSDQALFSSDSWLNFEDPSSPYLEIDIQEKPFHDRNVSKNKMNVILILLDAISRSQFYRSYPLTASYLEKYFNSTPNLQSKGYQFFRGQSTVGFTRWNLVNLRYGNHQVLLNITEGEQSQKSNQTYRSMNLENVAKQEGYVCAYSATHCGYYEYMPLVNNIMRNYMDLTVGDHLFIGPMCDPNVFPIENPYGPFQGPFSFRERCFLGNNVNKYAFEHNIDFNRKYKGKSKYSFVYLIDGHEFTTMLPQKGDELLLQYIKDLEKYKILENSMVVFFSDHGQHMTPFHSSSQGKIEKGNFFLMMLYPQKYLSNDIDNTLSQNQQRLISHIDLHKTIIQVLRNTDIANVQDNEKYNFNDGYDILHEIIDENRDCSRLILDQELCICSND